MAPNIVCLSALGRERPGIVAAITGVLYDNDCNVRDSTMTILAGEFAMMVIVELPERVAAAELESALGEVRRRFDLGLTVKRLDEDETGYHPGVGSKIWGITVYGGDRKGMLHQLASLLARRGVSITELKTKVLGGLEGAGIISMKVRAPAELELSALRGELEDVASRFGVEVSVG